MKAVSDMGKTKTPAKNQEKNAFEVLACTNTALRRAARRLGNLYDDALAPLGLKATQIGLLSEIERLAAANEGKAPSLQDLATKLSIQISAVTHALRPLIRDGLVELQPDKEDRRAKRGVLTPAGSARLNEALVYWAMANQRVEQVLGRDSAATLRALADHVASDAFLAEYRDGQNCLGETDDTTDDTNDRFEE
jgi:DNA-binding MarR family transcriptional regulator